MQCQLLCCSMHAVPATVLLDECSSASGSRSACVLSAVFPRMLRDHSSWQPAARPTSHTPTRIYSARHQSLGTASTPDHHRLHLQPHHTPPRPTDLLMGCDGMGGSLIKQQDHAYACKPIRIFRAASGTSSVLYIAESEHGSCGRKRHKEPR